VAERFRIDVCEEVSPGDKHVDRYGHLGVGRGANERCIVTDSQNRSAGRAVEEPVDQLEFAKRWHRRRCEYSRRATRERR